MVFHWGIIAIALCVQKDQTMPNNGQSGFETAGHCGKGTVPFPVHVSVSVPPGAHFKLNIMHCWGWQWQPGFPNSTYAPVVFFQKIQSAWNFLIKKGIPNTYCNYFDSASSTDKLKMRDVLVGGISIALAASSRCWEVTQTYTLTLKSPLRGISVVRTRRSSS